MLLYAYVLCDDAFQIHERGGIAIAKYWGYEGARAVTGREGALGLKPKDFGELTIYGAFGLLFLALISIACLRSTRDLRNVSKDLTLLLGVTLFFGVIIDMLHSVAGEAVILQRFSELLRTEGKSSP